MADTFQLEIVTPERMVVRDNAEEAQIPATTGYIGVLPGHAPLITELGAGEISYRSGGQVHRFAAAWGFAEVLPDKLTILAETVEPANEIDLVRAKQDLAQSEDALKKAQSEEEVTNDLGRVRRAEARIEVAEARNS